MEEKNKAIKIELKIKNRVNKKCKKNFINRKEHKKKIKTEKSIKRKIKKERRTKN